MYEKKDAHRKALEAIAKRIGDELDPREVIHHLKDGKAILTKYSKTHYVGDRYNWYFGLAESRFRSCPIDILFIFFICGSEDQILIIPATYLSNFLKSVRLVSGNSWRINIFKSGNVFEMKVAQKPMTDVSVYLNRYNLLRDSSQTVTQNIFNQIAAEVEDKPLTNNSPKKSEEKMLKLECINQPAKHDSALHEKSLEDKTIFDENEDQTPLETSPDTKRRAVTEEQTPPLETIHAWVQRGKLNLQPEFQRYYVWNRSKASRLIESLLLDIPIPATYVAEEEDANYSVVDGQQRLTALCAFIDGRFADGTAFRLSGLKVLKGLIGKSFKDLDSGQQESILGSSFRITIIKKSSDPTVKFEVFERLNLGSVKLNDQELRNCMYRGNYNDILKELAKDQTMLNIMGLDEPHYRMQDRHLILRFFAMWHRTYLKYKAPMKKFLNDEMEENRNLSRTELDNMRVVFKKSIGMAYSVFGKKAFRRFNPGNEEDPNGHWERKLNVALWDTILYTFSFYEKSQIVPIADGVREEFLDLMMQDSTFVKYITSTTDKPERVRYRADIWRQRLKTLVSSPGPRTFSPELKRKLYEDKPICGICDQDIHEIDDAELDHIRHYWRGGKTIPQNARLTHRYCNRARGGRI